MLYTNSKHTFRFENSVNLCKSGKTLIESQSLGDELPALHSSQPQRVASVNRSCDSYDTLDDRLGAGWVPGVKLIPIFLQALREFGCCFWRFLNWITSSRSMSSGQLGNLAVVLILLLEMIFHQDALPPSPSKNHIPQVALKTGSFSVYFWWCWVVSKTVPLPPNEAHMHLWWNVNVASRIWMIGAVRG